ncbi:aspartate racemase [Roseovarius tolerans]|uniref:Aspartate racemase n=1 Tax=Roseovarius tolerans TaxID=74031 RepID=A0A1H8JVD9_9RHOB|nr:aspartate/glutamate racemase family protein [Roseovarius tolerans]SEN84561.1 aspartate racemase [Roseovarius tolerans]
MEKTFRKIGLVGGVGWPATILYYEGLCRAARASLPGGSPRLAIESLDMRETLALRGTPGNPQSWTGFDATFRDALSNLERGGCKIAAIASVTPHARFSDIIDGISIPVVSIVDAAVQTARKHALTSVIVLGTPVTMTGVWFHEALRASSIDCPDIVTQDDIQEIADLLEKHFYPGRGAEGRAALLGICHRLAESRPSSAIVLACTDFSTAFPEFATGAVIEVEGLTFLDAGLAHIQAILSAATIHS